MSDDATTVNVNLGAEIVYVDVGDFSAPAVVTLIAPEPASITVPVVVGGGSTGGGSGSTTNVTNNITNVTVTGSGSGGLGDDEITIIGDAGHVGDAKGLTDTSTGHRVHALEVEGFEFDPGMGPFFSTVLPDGTVALPQIQLSLNQVASTGQTMSMGFYDPHLGVYYGVRVPTTTGAFTVRGVNSAGVQDTVGGADLSDTTVVQIGGVDVLFGISAMPYRGWNTTTYGQWPVLPAFTKSDTSGRWEYNASLSIFPATLRASHADGPNAWPNVVNSFGQTVTTTLLPGEMVTLPDSQHIAAVLYAPRAGHRSGGMVVINPVTKTQTAWYEFADMDCVWSGTQLQAFPRDLNADPTSVAGDERIIVNFDSFKKVSEVFNAVVWATGGTFRLSWAGTFTAAIPFGASDLTVQAALEAIPAIGAGNVTVWMSRAFGTNAYTVYEIELCGAMARTDFTATAVTIDLTSLTGNLGSHITRWRHGNPTTFPSSAPFPIREVAYTGTALTPTCPELFPLSADLNRLVPEADDATYGMAWYGRDGTLWAFVTGVNDNPENSTYFEFRGIHGFRKDPNTGQRSYNVSYPAGQYVGNVGLYHPRPDVMSDSVHHQAGQFPLAICEDIATGGIIVATSTGRIKTLLPEPGLLPRSGNILPSDNPAAGWTVNGPHTAVWDPEVLALKLTAANTTDIRVNTGTGLLAVPIPASYEGEPLQFQFDVKSVGSTYPRVKAVIRFYDAAGTELAVTGSFPSMYDSHLGWTELMAAAAVPVGARFVTAEVTVAGHPGGDIHWIRNTRLYIAPFTAGPDIETGIGDVYAGATGGPWLAKGFVDPKTRSLWLPFTQFLTVGQASNVVHPSWLLRVDTEALFPGESGLTNIVNNTTVVVQEGGSGTGSDATTISKGVVQLAGDLGGTASSPSVPGLAARQLTSAKGAASGYPALDSTTKVPVAQLGTGTADASTFLRGDRTWAAPAGGGGGGVSLGSTTPLANGTAAVGAAGTAAHTDHVHPTTGLVTSTGGGKEGLATNTAATGAVTINLASGNVHALTLTGNVTITLTGATAGFACTATLVIKQDASGSRLITWPASVKWSPGTPPLVTTANAVSMVVLQTVDNGATWLAGIAGSGYV